MTKVFDILLIVAVTAVIVYGCSEEEPGAPKPIYTEYDVVVSDYGDLADTLNTRKFSLDSIAVHGPIAGMDMRTLTDTEIKVLNLRDAKAKDGIIPSLAFWRENGIEGRRIYLPGNSVELRLCFIDEMVAFVEIPEGVEIIPQKCFWMYFPLKEVVLPNSVKVIQKGAFYRTGIKRLRFPENLELIESDAFKNSYLEEAILNDKCKEIEPGAFYHCNLKRMRLPKGLKVIPYELASGLQTLTEVEFSVGNEIIERSAFYLTGIKKIILPEGMRILENNSLGSYDTREIDLPSTIEMIEKEAFWISQEKTQFVRIRAVTPPECSANGFKYFINDEIQRDPDSDIDIPLYVPKGSAEKYRNATGWSRFSNIIEE